MKESKLKKDRWCNTCARKIWGDAKKIKEHVEYHKLAQKFSHVLIPETRVVLLGDKKQNSKGSTKA